MARPLLLPALLLAALLAAPARAQDLLHTLNSSASRFGEAVAAVPDVDADGVEDLLVGAPFSGSAHLYSGADGALLRTFTSPNLQSAGAFGDAVAGVPDADGDGRGDVLIADPAEDVTIGGTLYVEAGRAYLFSGATGAFLRDFVSPNPELPGPGEEGQFGSALAGVPDTNGDGRGDVLIGSRYEDLVIGTTAYSSAGRVYLFSGATGALRRQMDMPRPNAGYFFGLSVAGLDDVDGDGRGDLLVGAINRAFVFSGATGQMRFDLRSPGGGLDDGFGSSVAGVPDANGDGTTDLVIHEPEARRTYLLSGADGTSLFYVTHGGYPDGPVAGVPDTNGDGRGDFLVGAGGGGTSPTSTAGPTAPSSAGTPPSTARRSTSGGPWRASPTRTATGAATSSSGRTARTAPTSSAAPPCSPSPRRR